MAGVVPSTKKDNCGYTEEDYIRMMDDVAIALIDGDDEALSTTQERLRHDQPRAPREGTHQTFPAMDDAVEDRQGSSEVEQDMEAGGKQDLATAKGSGKSGKSSKTRKEVHRGLTRVNADGELEWLATDDTEGVLAVRHHKIRPQLIAIAETERVALCVQLDHPDEPGPGEYNVTSFYHKHVHWGPSREDRPEITFDWEEDVEKTRPGCPGYMYWEEDGKKYLVLDPHDNPIKDWDIPSTIASNVPGYKLEAMRRENMSLEHLDFWARMPSHINVGTVNRPKWEELGHPNSIVNMPMERFRFHAGLCSWTRRKNTLIIKAGLMKLYGNKLHNNTVRAFGRDLTIKEIDEVKKGDNGVFSIEGHVAPASGRVLKRGRTKGAAKPVKPKGNAKMGNGQSRKRKHTTDDERQSSEEKTTTQVRSHKRARHGRKENSIAAEVDDLDMFGQTPTFIDQANASMRYSLRSTRKDASSPKRTEILEDISNENSADEEYEDFPRPILKVMRIRAKNQGVELDLREGSLEDSEDGTPRFPFRRLPRAGEVNGKSKGPSWMSSTRKETHSDEKEDYRHTAVPLNIDGKIYYATYEGLISNWPMDCPGGDGIHPQRQDPKPIGASHASDIPKPQAFEVMMNMPWFEQRNLEEEDTPLQAHRKRVRDFLEDVEAEAHSPPLKRIQTEYPLLPPTGSAMHGASSNLPQQNFPPPSTSSQFDDSSSDPPSPHAQPSETRKQTLEAEWARTFE